jgi:hypothetical protein
LHLVELRERNAYAELLDFRAQITNLRLTCGDTDVGAWFLESRCLIGIGGLRDLGLNQRVSLTLAEVIRSARDNIEYLHLKAGL